MENPCKWWYSDKNWNEPFDEYFKKIMERIGMTEEKEAKMVNTKITGNDLASMIRKASQEKDDEFTAPVHLVKNEKEGKIMGRIQNGLETYVKMGCSWSPENGSFVSAEVLAKAILGNYECSDELRKILERTVERGQREKARKNAAERKAREIKRQERWKNTSMIVDEILDEYGIATWNFYRSYARNKDKIIRSTLEFACFINEYAKNNKNVRASKDHVMTLYTIDYLKEKYNI